ncbi:MAG: MTH1187 family thiamine-binding protein [Calditerrivibrio sp.]|nr:MTH1187 family thiamine-binding protein [Calditerrivibrio sp.]
MSAMCIFSVTPLGKEESVSKYVAKVVKVVKDSGLKWQLTPMGTIIEGEDLQVVFKVIDEGVRQLEECNRISITIKIDYKKDRKSGMQEKVESVMEKLNN